jgi:pimeloyl-ACP methyl ester carboxylesterase
MFYRTLIAVIALVLCCPLATTAQSPAAGRWDGAIKVMGQELPISIVVSGEGAALAATIDIQGLTGLPLRNVRMDGGKVHFELAAGLGLVILDGEIKGDVMSGTFEQGPAKGTFEARRGGAAVAPAEPPSPYRQEEVKIQAGGVTLAGTLTIPPTAGPHPAVVLITGSGAQNRDEELFGFKPFKVIADHLTRAGIAVLRCDDRGVGGSTGSVAQSTSADFADDALAEVQFLRARPDIDKTHVGLLGHSEGGIVAPMAAVKSTDVAFIVLISGPSLTGEQILLAQADLLQRAAGVPEEQIRKNADVQRQMFTAVRSGTGWEAIIAAGEKSVVTELARLPEAQRQALGDIDAFARRQVAGQLAFPRSPWFKFFLDYDPAPTLAKVKVPVLAIFGGLDLQVPATTNRQKMEEVFAQNGHKDHRLVVIPRANHLYQEAVTGGGSEYPTLKKEFVPGFLDLVTSWIVEHCGMVGR